MAEGDGSAASGGYWAEWKAYWRARFAFLDNYKNVFLIPENPLPKWSAANVEEFIASDPVHGPTYCWCGLNSRLALKYSKSPHGAVLALGAGAVFGWTFAQEIASHWTRIYRLDTMDAQMKYLDWWKKCEE